MLYTRRRTLRVQPKHAPLSLDMNLPNLFTPASSAKGE